MILEKSKLFEATISTMPNIIMGREWNSWNPEFEMFDLLIQDIITNRIRNSDDQEGWGVSWKKTSLNGDFTFFN